MAEPRTLTPLQRRALNAFRQLPKEEQEAYLEEMEERVRQRTGEQAKAPPAS